MVKRLVYFLLKQTVILVITAVLALLTVRIIQERSGQPLKLWHTTPLINEYHAHRTDVPDFKSYLELEHKLFLEMNEKVDSKLPPEDRTLLNRYYSGSLSSPDRQARNWNHSFRFAPKNSRGAVVLIHGLTDSPYSMHALADVFLKRGYAVFVPRMPGHGTIPGALIQTTWPDWVAATHLACEAARQAAPGKPLILCGYSNGGLLAVKYALDEIDKGKDGQPPQKIILFAPAIGITRFAAVSGWYRILTLFPYFKKVQWLGLEPEYDPFKYNSFPKMASDQIYKLTLRVNQQLETLQAHDGFSAFPPTLTFTSAVDSTVLTPSLVDRFYSRLKPNGSELVLYDINRSEAMDVFITDKPDKFLASLTTAPALSYTLTLITNQQPNSLQVIARRRLAQTTVWTEESLHQTWPMGVYSLSHLAIPNSPADPLYGDRPDLRMKGQLVLGLLQPRGETGIVDVPASQFLRLRFNPFFEQLKQRVESFID